MHPNTLTVLDQIIKERRKTHPAHELHPSNIECREANEALFVLTQLRAFVAQTLGVPG